MASISSTVSRGVAHLFPAMWIQIVIMDTFASIMALQAHRVSVASTSISATLLAQTITTVQWDRSVTKSWAFAEIQDAHLAVPIVMTVVIAWIIAAQTFLVHQDLIARGEFAPGPPVRDQIVLMVQSNVC
jgi:hypothetical protein